MGFYVYGRFFYCGRGIPSCGVSSGCSWCLPLNRPVSLFVGETRSERVGDETTDTSEDQAGKRVPRTLEIFRIVTKEGNSTGFCNCRDLDVSGIIPPALPENADFTWRNRAEV